MESRFKNRNISTSENLNIAISQCSNVAILELCQVVAAPGQVPEFENDQVRIPRSVIKNPT